MTSNSRRSDSRMLSEATDDDRVKMKAKKTAKTKDGEKLQPRLMKFKDLPEYMKDNEFILDYYRCEWPLKNVLFSVFSWHNETLNIWTHLVGFLIFAALTAISLMEPMNKLGGSLLTNFSRATVPGSLLTMVMKDTNVSESTITNSEQVLQSSVFSLQGEDDSNSVPLWPWLVFLAGAMACLVCSSLSHLFACHSRSFNLFFWRLDYAGISMMIVCSFFAPIYYAFACNPYSRLFYLTAISLLGILAVITLLAPVLSAPRFRSFRAIIFLAMGFSGVIPAIHAIVLHWGQPQISAALGYELAMAFLYAAGAGFYVSRIPERWKPGAFDIAGHSHQIFHVFVVLGALAHSAATLFILDFRRSSPACAY